MFLLNLLVLMLLLTPRALAGTIAQNSVYQACIATPSTCTSLCVPRPSPIRVARAQLFSHEAAVAASV
jgi:hypothetical protein